MDKLSLILFCVAAIFNAVMDTLAHHHSTSIFSKYKTGFWSDATSVSWKNKYIDGEKIKGRRYWKINIKGKIIKIKILEIFTDAWHFFKFLVGLFICSSILTFKPNTDLFMTAVQAAEYIIGWVLFFGIFYNKLLIKKK